MSSRGPHAGSTAGPELDDLRSAIDEVDASMLDLLARRLEPVSLPAHTTRRERLPIYAPERERTMIAAKRELAEAKGVPADLIEDVLRRCMREAYTHEKSMGFTRQAPDLGPVVIVGGSGAMGVMFGKMLTLSGYEVRVLDRGDWGRSEHILNGAGMVLISVPIHDTVSIIESLPPLAPDALLVDITSVKQAPLEAMLAAHPGPVLGLHPMFGPDVESFAKQVVACCPGRGADESQWLIDQIRLWGARVHDVSATDHDAAMGLIQALRHFSTFVYGSHLAQEDRSLADLLALSSPIYRLELMMVGRLFAQSPELYFDIITSSKASLKLIDSYHARFGAALELLRSEDREGFARQFTEIGTYFGSYAERFLVESRSLLAHADATR